MRQMFRTFAVELYSKVAFIRPIYRFIRRVISRFKLKRLIRQRLAGQDPIKIVLGANKKYQPGWIPTEIYNLDILNSRDWEHYFSEGDVDAMLAEHVWEHFTEEEGTSSAELCYKYLKRGGYLRVAVPDGYFPDLDYIEWVKPGGIGPSADDHKVLHTYKTLGRIFEIAGFEIDLLEYFDENGEFHHKEWDPEEGAIVRSERVGKGRMVGDLKYKSLILDAKK